MVNRTPKPIVDKGFITVPNTPGLGAALNGEVVKKRLHPEYPGYFPPTPAWDKDRTNDRLFTFAGAPVRG